MMADRAAEGSAKIALIRANLGPADAVRLRGVDWFAWASAGGSNAVLLAAETGVAELVVTPDRVLLVTSEIEVQRLLDEELPPGFEIFAYPWATPEFGEEAVREAVDGARVLSDRPLPGESPLPKALVAAKRHLLLSEVKRYRQVGRFAAEAMTEAMAQAEEGWSEWQLAGSGAKALMQRGLQPALVLVAGERRVQCYRHPVPSFERIGRQAMMVFCARGFGLYANLTRFVSFGPLPAPMEQRHRLVREIEREALAHSRPGAQLKEVYQALAQAYASCGQSEAIREHHQGGTTGYLSREVIATPGATERIADHTAVAWNPSLRGAKCEDTFLVTEGGVENLTFDPNWPGIEISGVSRPLVWER